VEVTTCHRLCAEAVAAPQDDGEERHAEARRDREQARRVADETGGFGFRTDHEAGCVAQRDDGKPEDVAELEKSRELVACIGVECAAEVLRAVGDQTDRATFDANE
jgi:hypothetical protein